MKKIICALLSCLLLLSLAACREAPADTPATNPPADAPAVDTPAVEDAPTVEDEPVIEDTPIEDDSDADESSSELETMMQSIVADVNPEIAVMNVPVDAERFYWFFGVDYVEGCEAYGSEAMIGSIPHTVGLLKAPDDVDAEELAATIESNLDPRKWICVEAERCFVLQNGQYILAVMTFADEAQGITDNFNALFAE